MQNAHLLQWSKIWLLGILLLQNTRVTRQVVERKFMMLLRGGFTGSALLGKNIRRPCMVILSSPGEIPQHQTCWILSETLVNPQFVKDHPAQEGLRITVPLLCPDCCFQCKAVQTRRIHSRRYKVCADYQLVLVIWAAEPISPEQAQLDCYQHPGWQV